MALRSIAITNQKGGVGKTTTTVNLGAALTQAGQRVCLIDLDPQAHLTMHLGLEPGRTKPSVYELLGGSVGLAECVQTVRPNLDLVPAEIDLAGAEVELVGVVGREILLRDALDPVRDRYDVLLIDCPPSLGLLTINALSAVEEVFIALQPHFLALQGLGKLLETVSLVQRRINDRLRISGVMLCMYDSRTALCAEVAAEVARFFEGDHPLKMLWEDAHIFRSQIRRNIRLAEAPGHGKTIFEYSASSHGAQDYQRLAEELLAVWRGDTPEAQVDWQESEAEEEPEEEESDAIAKAGTDVDEEEAEVVAEAGEESAEPEGPVVAVETEPMAEIVAGAAGMGFEPSDSEVVAVDAEVLLAEQGGELSGVENSSEAAAEVVNPSSASEVLGSIDSGDPRTDEGSIEHGTG